FPLGWAEKISNCRPTQSIQKSKNPTFLYHQRAATIQNRLRAGIVPDRNSDRDALILERPAQRRFQEVANRWRKSPLRLLCEAHRPTSLVGCVDDVEVAGHLSPPDGEDKNLHRHVDVNDKTLRHRSHRAVEW